MNEKYELKIGNKKSRDAYLVASYDSLETAVRDVTEMMVRAMRVSRRHTLNTYDSFVDITEIEVSQKRRVFFGIPLWKKQVENKTGAVYHIYIDDPDEPLRVFKETRKGSHSFRAHYASLADLVAKECKKEKK